MNENLIMWIILGVLGIWKIVWECKNCRARSEYLVLARPEALLAYLLIILQSRSLFDIYRFDIVMYDMLTSPKVDEQVQLIPTDSKDHYSIPDSLRQTALISPFLGSFASLLALFQLACMLRYSRDSDVVKGTKASVIFTPVFFIVMNTRSLIRILAVLTGSAWAGYLRANPDTAQSDLKSAYSLLETEEEGLYNMDLELGCAFQYVAVFSFARVCSHYIKIIGTDTGTVENTDNSTAGESLNDLSWGFRWAGIQGIYAYIVLGVFRCLGNFGVSCAVSFYHLPEETVDEFQESALAKLNVMFTFATVLCIYNMFILDKMQGIRQQIRMASIKFLGTRMLLLIAQIQPSILKQLQSNSKLMINMKAMFPHVAMLQAWELSDKQGDLWHVALLEVECLVLVIFNLVMWGCPCPCFGGERKPKAEAREVGDRTMPLLTADSAL